MHIKEYHSHKLLAFVQDCSNRLLSWLSKHLAQACEWPVHSGAEECKFVLYSTHGNPFEWSAQFSNCPDSQCDMSTECVDDWKSSQLRSSVLQGKSVGANRQGAPSLLL